jgi:hypothetical protein
MAFSFISPYNLNLGFAAEDKRIAEQDAAAQKLELERFALQTKQEQAPLQQQYLNFKLQDAQQALSNGQLDRQRADQSFAASAPARELTALNTDYSLTQAKDRIAIEAARARAGHAINGNLDTFAGVFNDPTLTASQRIQFQAQQAPAFLGQAQSAIAANADPARIIDLASHAGLVLNPPPPNATPDQLNVWRIEAARAIGAKANSFAAQNYDKTATNAAALAPQLVGKAATATDSAAVPESGVPGIGDLQKHQINLSKEIRGALKDGVPETDPLMVSLRAQYATSERMIQQVGAAAMPKRPPANPDYSAPLGNEGNRAIMPTVPTPATSRVAATAAAATPYAAPQPAATNFAAQPAGEPDTWATDIAKLKAQLQALPASKNYIAERDRLNAEIARLYALVPEFKATPIVNTPIDAYGRPAIPVTNPRYAR